MTVQRKIQGEKTRAVEVDADCRRKEADAATLVADKFPFYLCLEEMPNRGRNQESLSW